MTYPVETVTPRLEATRGPGDWRDAPLRHLRDAVAEAYCVDPSVVAPLKAETLVWMVSFRWGPLDHVHIHRVV